MKKFNKRKTYEGITLLNGQTIIANHVFEAKIQTNNKDFKTCEDQSTTTAWYPALMTSADHDQKPLK